jgi:tetratricopeptide (TPR) repeat protein
MSVEEARKIVLGAARSPALIFDKQEPVQDNQIVKVYVGRTIIAITGRNGMSYDIILKNSNPAYDTNYNPRTDNGWTYIYLDNRKEIYGGENMDIALYGDPKYDKQVVDALLVLKNAAIKFTENDEARFQEAVRQYPASGAKPPVPETARRFEVQAEGAVSDKDFGAATDLYEQALEIVPWWPADHFNLALVLAELDDFPEAIVEMKRYLALAPDAPNARTAQDKIYDWERKAPAAS